MRALGLALVLGLAVSGPVQAGNSRYGYNWDEIGTEFCRLTLANDMAGLLRS